MTAAKSTFYVVDDEGDVSWFVAGAEVPAWVADKVANPDLLDGDAGDKPTRRTRTEK